MTDSAAGGDQHPQFRFVEIAAADAWADLLAGLPTTSVYTSWPWGDYKRRTGWTVARVTVRRGDDNALVGCTQVQTRQFGPCRVVLVQGGIHGVALSEDGIAALLAEFQNAYVRLRSADVFLFSHHAVPAPAVAIALQRVACTPIVSTGMYSYLVDVSQSLAALEAGLSGNWRHNLKRAQRNGQLSASWVTDAAGRRRALEALQQMYGALTRRKSFAGAIDMRGGLDWIANDPRFEIVQGSVGGSIVAARVVYVANDHVMDFLAASHERAKSIYANYLLMWSVVARAHELRKRFVECGGIDPEGNPGVFNFKKGLGGSPVLLGPLWLYTRNRFLRNVIRPWIARSG